MCPNLAVYKQIFLHALRMANLEEPMDRRKGHLEDSLRLQQFYRSAEEEQQWVRECRPQAASTDYGKTMSQVEKLQKKHQVGGRGSGCVLG